MFKAIEQNFIDRYMQTFLYRWKSYFVYFFDFRPF